MSNKTKRVVLLIQQLYPDQTQYKQYALTLVPVAGIETAISFDVPGKYLTDNNEMTVQAWAWIASQVHAGIEEIDKQVRAEQTEKIQRRKK